MKSIFTTLLIIFLFITTGQNVLAQEFIKSPENNNPSFRQVQRDFYEWKKNHSINEIKGWKTFKRWEHETQLHTNGHGETDGVEAYLAEMVRVAGEKSLSRSALTTAPWVPTGPYNLPNNLTGYMENGMGRVNCVAFDPVNPAVFYVGVAQGGVWKTTNNGNTYTPLTDNLPITRVSDIAIDPSNPNTIFISVCDFEYVGVSLFTSGRKRHTHYGIGVYKSTDGGLTWSPTGLGFQQTQGDASLIRKIIVDPNNSSNIVACGVSGMYKSNNGGANFTQVLDSLFWDMLQDPVNPNVLYAATGWIKAAGIGFANIYKSTDFGSTWTKLTTGIPQQGFVQRVKLAQSPSNPNILYALTVDTLGGLYAIYKTTNAGNTWNLHYNALNLLTYDEGTGTGGQGNYDLGFAVDLTNPNKVYVGGINLWMTTNGGNTFNPAGHWTTSYGPSIHADVHEIKIHPATGQIYVCHDGGIYRTGNVIPETWANLNNGFTFQTLWTNLSNGMNVTSFYRISSSKTNTGELCAGAQDNATFYYDGVSWHTVYGGDGMDNVFDTANFGSFIASSQFGNFTSTIDGGFSFNWIDPNVNFENAEWTTPIIADPSNYQKLYCGYENIVVSTDGGNTWASTSPLPLPPNFYGNELSAIAISPVNSNILWAGRRVRYEFSNPAAMFRSSNGGSTWVNVTAGLPDSLYYTSIETDQFNAGTAFVSMAGFTAGQKVFKTINNGNAWTNISYNLPNIPVNCVKQVPGRTDLVAATDIGVYLLPGGTTSWINISQGLPNVIVSDIEFNPSLNKAYICTFGRGIWETDLNLLSGLDEPEQMLVDFTITPSLNNGQFEIVLRDPITEFSTLEVIDVNGRLVYQQQLTSDRSNLQLSLQDGAYYARVRNSEKSGVQRFNVAY